MGERIMDASNMVPTKEEMLSLLPRALPKSWEIEVTQASAGTIAFEIRIPSDMYKICPSCLKGFLQRVGISGDFYLSPPPLSKYEYKLPLVVAWYPNPETAREFFEFGTGQSLLAHGLNAKVPGSVIDISLGDLIRTVLPDKFEEIEKIVKSVQKQTAPLISEVIFEKGKLLGEEAIFIVARGKKLVHSVLIENFVVQGLALNYHIFPPSNAPVHSIVCERARHFHNEPHGRGNCRCGFCRGHPPCSTRGAEGMANREDLEKILRCLFTQIKSLGRRFRPPARPPKRRSDIKPPARPPEIIRPKLRPPVPPEVPPEIKPPARPEQKPPEVRLPEKPEVPAERPKLPEVPLEMEPPVIKPPIVEQPKPPIIRSGSPERKSPEPRPPEIRPPFEKPEQPIVQPELGKEPHGPAPPDIWQPGEKPLVAKPKPLKARHPRSKPPIIRSRSPEGKPPEPRPPEIRPPFEKPRSPIKPGPSPPEPPERIPPVQKPEPAPQKHGFPAPVPIPIFPFPRSKKDEETVIAPPPRADVFIYYTIGDVYLERGGKKSKIEAIPFKKSVRLKDGDKIITAEEAYVVDLSDQPGPEEAGTCMSIFPNSEVVFEIRGNVITRIELVRGLLKINTGRRGHVITPTAELRNAGMFWVDVSEDGTVVVASEAVPMEVVHKKSKRGVIIGPKQQVTVTQADVLGPSAVDQRFKEASKLMETLEQSKLKFIYGDMLEKNFPQEAAKLGKIVERKTGRKLFEDEDVSKSQKWLKEQKEFWERKCDEAVKSKLPEFKQVKAEEKTAPVAKPKITRIDKTINYQGVDFKIVSAEKRRDFKSRTAPEDKDFLVLNIEAKNNSSRQVFVFYGEEVRLINESGEVTPLEDYMLETSFDPGAKSNGYLLFLIDKKIEKFKLQFGKKSLPKVEVEFEVCIELPPPS